MDIGKLYEELGRTEVAIDDARHAWETERQGWILQRRGIDDVMNKGREKFKDKIDTQKNRAQVIRNAIKMAVGGMDPLVAKLTAEQIIHESEFHDNLDDECDDECVDDGEII